MVVITRNSSAATAESAQTSHRKSAKYIPSMPAKKLNGCLENGDACNSADSVTDSIIGEVLDRRIGPTSGSLEYYVKTTCDSRTKRFWIDWNALEKRFPSDEMQKVAEFDKKYEDEIVALLQSEQTTSRIKHTFATRLIFDPRSNAEIFDPPKRKFLLEVYLSNSSAMDRTAVLSNTFMRQYLRKALCEFYEDTMVKTDSAEVVPAPLQQPNEPSSAEF